MITVTEYHDIEAVTRKPKEAESFCQKASLNNYLITKSAASNAGRPGLVRSKIKERNCLSMNSFSDIFKK